MADISSGGSGGILKTIQGSIVALQNVTVAPRVVTSSDINVTNYLSATIFIHLGRLTTSAFTAGVNFRIESSAASSGNGQWYPATIFTSPIGSSVASQAVSAAAPAGQKVIPIANTAGFAVGNIIFISNPVTGNSEWARVTTVTLNTSLTVEDNLINDQTTSTVYNQAEMYLATIDTTSMVRLRVVVDGSGSAQNFAVEVKSITGR